MGNRGLQINPVGVLASCGLGLNLVWCTLMGHTLGFKMCIRDSPLGAVPCRIR